LRALADVEVALGGRVERGRVVLRVEIPEVGLQSEEERGRDRGGALRRELVEVGPDDAARQVAAPVVVELEIQDVRLGIVLLEDPHAHLVGSPAQEIEDQLDLAGGRDPERLRRKSTPSRPAPRESALGSRGAPTPGRHRAAAAHAGRRSTNWRILLRGQRGRERQESQGGEMWFISL
jgi:hypothetical protein